MEEFEKRIKTTLEGLRYAKRELDKRVENSATVNKAIEEFETTLKHISQFKRNLL